jgi:hypothetical protein
LETHITARLKAGLRTLAAWDICGLLGGGGLFESEVAAYWPESIEAVGFAGDRRKTVNDHGHAVGIGLV